MFKIHFYVILKNISYLTFRIDWLNWRLPLWTTLVELELIYARFLDWLSHIICVFLGNCAKNNSYSENAMIIQKERKKERFFLWGKRLLLSCNVPYHKSSVSCCCFFFSEISFFVSHENAIVSTQMHAVESIKNISVVVKMCNCTCRTCI